MKYIEIKGARLHNLKNIDVSIPKEKFVVITGVSGSGKSSLVFDILFQEGCCGYLQSIGFPEKASSEERYFDEIYGLVPAIAVEQRIIRSSNPRSVVGTKTKIYDQLKMLYSIDGQMECVNCNVPLDESLTCPLCGQQFGRPSPRYFSFNSQIGRCTFCEGRGIIYGIDIHKIITSGKTSIAHILKPDWLYGDLLDSIYLLRETYEVDLNRQYEGLQENVKEALLNGFNSCENKEFEGILPYLQRKSQKGNVRERIYLSHRMEGRKCPKCKGLRLNETGLSVKIEGLNIGELGNLTLLELKHILSRFLIMNKVSQFGKQLIKNVGNEIMNFEELGLSHLSLFREIPTLSGGETQRLHLVSQIHSKMDSLLYIFDEPTSGLHEQEKELLLKKLMELKKNGNSLIVVEHDENTIQQSDYILDFGPLAGKEGGEIVYQGDYKGLLDADKSVTGAYLSGKLKIPSKQKSVYYNVIDAAPRLQLENVNTNNLKGINVEIPLGMMVGIAGVSGSGKSSLISGTLVPALQSLFYEQKKETGKTREEELEEDIIVMLKANIERIRGVELIKDYAYIPQKPIGRNKRSIPLTYLDLWDKVRNYFASQPAARESGLTQDYFSFNSKGACQLCQGSGVLENQYYQMGVFSSICPECHGTKYNKNVLEIKYKHKSILDILNMSISEGIEFFKGDNEICSMLELLEGIGMGYLLMGQPVPTLSGGEAQRIKLAKELGKARKGNVLYILDEPTTGLSFYDISILLKLLDDIVKGGNSVIVIEHDPYVLSFCDFIIELGPGGGYEGGEVVALGTPLDLMNNISSKTGRYLKIQQ